MSEDMEVFIKTGWTGPSFCPECGTSAVAVEKLMRLVGENMWGKDIYEGGFQCACEVCGWVGYLAKREKTICDRVVPK